MKKFEQWITDTQTSILEEEGQQRMLTLSCHCHVIINDGCYSAPLQVRRLIGLHSESALEAHSAIDAFPYCKFQLTQNTAIRDMWTNMASLGGPIMINS